MTQQEKIARFRALHEAPGAFLIPNPWDVGSARMLAGLGFGALATSSSASAATLGRLDYHVTRSEALAMARAIVLATDIPVSADLENGFGDSVTSVHETVRLAIEAGLAGCSIEDAAGDAPPYDLSLATERVAAAAEAAHAGGCGFVLTARAENFLRDKADLDDTIRRLQAYERAGADVLFAPGLPNLDAVRTVCRSVGKPVNVIGYMQGGQLSVEDLTAAGAKRISLATGLYRAAMSGLRAAALEMRDRGTFASIRQAIAPAELAQYLRS